MTTTVSDTFKVVATPSQELQLELSNLAAKGNDAVNIAHKKPADIETKKDNERNDMALNVLQQISEQERIHQEYRKQAQQINYAIDMALADASTAEEREAILEYQSFVEEVDQNIEQKREADTLTQEDLEQAHQEKMRTMPETVKAHLPDDFTSPAISQSELASLESLSASSFAASVDNTHLDDLSDMNLSFQKAASGQGMSESEPTDPLNTPSTPADFSKFTM